MNERRGSLMGQATWELTRKIVHPEIEGAENFAIAKEHLRNGGTVLAYSNDPLKKTEIPIVGIAIETHLTSIDHLGGFISRRQVDTSIGIPNKIQNFILMDIWAKYPGVKMIPIVQPKDRGRYPDWEKFNEEAFEEGKAHLRKPGNVFGITPEGQRSPTLLEAEAGLAVMFRDAKDIALAIPFGIHHDSSKITVGRPFSWADSLADYKRNPTMKTKDRMMVRLAILLKEQQRGHYAQMAKDFVWPQAA